MVRIMPPHIKFSRIALRINQKEVLEASDGPSRCLVESGQELLDICRRVPDSGRESSLNTQTFKLIYSFIK